ncbi:MAG: peptidoglycan DD-metalloendopeptidase family protein [Congregibacter sp.]
MKFYHPFFVACLFGIATHPLAACIDLQGDPAEGGVIWGVAPVAAQVSLDGESLDVLPDGRFFAAFHRDSATQSVLMVVSRNADGAADCSVMVNVQQRDYRISRVEGVPQRTVTPPAEQLERIRRERTLVASAKAQFIARPDWLQQMDGGFRWPVEGRISGVYGSQRFYNGNPGSPHYGVDIAVPTGTPIKAPASGRVTLAEPDLFYSGGTVILDHGYGFSSSFLHMSEVTVAVGDELSVGDVLGAVGATGRATGPHLDWRMSWRGRRVDPQRLVPPMNDRN